jgi:hypothetical protein
MFLLHQAHFNCQEQELLMSPQLRVQTYMQSALAAVAAVAVEQVLMELFPRNMELVEAAALAAAVALLCLVQF